jgi:hypothetical protein
MRAAFRVTWRTPGPRTGTGRPSLMHRPGPRARPAIPFACPARYPAPPISGPHLRTTAANPTHRKSP